LIFFILFLMCENAPSTLALGRKNLKTVVSLWKRIKYFPSTPRGICVWVKLEQGNSLTIIMSLFSKSFVSKLGFPSTLKLQRFSLNFSGLKSVFVKLCFHNGSVWTVRLTGEKKLRFQISATFIVSSDCPKLWHISCNNHNLVFCETSG